MWTVYVEKEFKNLKETSGLNYIYTNELDESYFARDAAYSDSYFLAKKTILDKILRDRAYKIAKNPKYDGYQRGLANMMCKLFDKKIGSGANVNELLAQELHKPVKKIKRRKVYAMFKDNI